MNYFCWKGISRFDSFDVVYAGLNSPAQITVLQIATNLKIAQAWHWNLFQNINPNFPKHEMKWLLHHKTEHIYYKDQSNLTRFVLNLFQDLVSFNSMQVLRIYPLWLFFQLTSGFSLLIPVWVGIKPQAASLCFIWFHNERKFFTEVNAIFQSDWLT